MTKYNFDNYDPKFRIRPELATKCISKKDLTDDNFFIYFEIYKPVNISTKIKGVCELAFATENENIAKAICASYPDYTYTKIKIEKSKLD